MRFFGQCFFGVLVFPVTVEACFRHAVFGSGANEFPEPVVTPSFLSGRSFSGRRFLLVLILAFLALPVLAADGLRFSCEPARLTAIEARMSAYLKALDIDASLYVKQAEEGFLTYTLATPPEDTDTLDFHQRPEMRLRPETLVLPAGQGKTRKLRTVSKKEIVLALMQHGRTTEFSGEACEFAALQEHVALRQNIVAWGEKLAWRWPNGGRARWNSDYWDRGTPKPGVPLASALQDAFDTQARYRIGCYAATKLLLAQGVFDFYRRFQPDKAALVEARLDGEPLVDVEPAAMWSFEADFDQATLKQPGKLFKLIHGLAPGNFVPGDWAYLRNTDPVSARHTGYEGSNAVYLGGGRFDDLYNDNHHGYTYREKLDEVFQWRYGVFSRSRHFRSVHPLSARDFKRLGKAPADGGLLMDYRAVPYLFGYERLAD